ncbi:hypothetical protein KFK09_004204 [Dendrobium nobile]|uniref:Uncharacterized protein n=1 Tax=Dendrobium nobile TaxID=94219 RepID=A0A8T3BZS9_DENNO|nr:hypothetical protein KFK09_004204 [Dendrobium nobile]
MMVIVMNYNAVGLSSKAEISLMKMRKTGILLGELPKELYFQGALYENSFY